MTATQSDMIAELQRANAELRRERDAALAHEAALAKALAQRNTEYGERIEQQYATIDVLKVMSASPGDPQPVFDLIVRRAQELCNSKAAGIYEYDGELVHVRIGYGARDIAGATAYFAASPCCRYVDRSPVGQFLTSRSSISAIPGRSRNFCRLCGTWESRSTLAIPCMRDGAAIGAFAINSLELGGFSDSQVALLETFAEQAVIAINSAETYRALQTRTSDLQESLEYQTATSDLLKVISRSTFDLQPVLDMVAETAASFAMPIMP